MRPIGVLGLLEAVVIVLISTSCGEQQSGADMNVGASVAAVAAAAEHPVYYLGSAYGGYPLTYAEADDGEHSPRIFGPSFTYGDCDDSNGGCVPPLQVQNNAVFNGGGTNPESVVDCRRLKPVRGVPAASWGGGIAVFTGRSMIQIFANRGHLHAVARALRPIKGAVDSSAALPAPPLDVLQAIAKACGAVPGDHGPRLPPG
jgi:hypothetical protein